jgi:hypothetical protein
VDDSIVTAAPADRQLQTARYMGKDIRSGLAFADVLVKSGLTPRGIDSAAKAFFVILKGIEMGLPPISALTHIAIVDGKPTVSAELMLAKMHEAGVKTVAEQTDKGASITVTKPGEKPQTFSFTEGDAKAANLLGKQNWRQYPKAMYWARVVALAKRSACPEVLIGASYVPEELGADTDDEGIAGPPIVQSLPAVGTVAEQANASERVADALLEPGSKPERSAPDSQPSGAAVASPPKARRARAADAPASSTGSAPAPLLKVLLENAKKVACLADDGDTIYITKPIADACGIAAVPCKASALTTEQAKAVARKLYELSRSGGTMSAEVANG